MTTGSHEEKTTMPAFATPEPITAVIDVPAAHLRIEASERADTVVEISPSDASNDADVEIARQTKAEYSDGRLLVKTSGGPSTRSFGWGISLDKLVESPADWVRSLISGGGTVEVTISLPAGSRVEGGAAADVRCRGPLGDVRFTTSLGDIRVDQAARLRLKSDHGDISVGRAAGHAELTTTHGSIGVGGIDGTAVIKTAHGEVTLGTVTGELRLSSAHADVTVDRALSGVVAKTAYGSLTIGEVVSGAVVMETTGGGLELGIRQGTSAWLDVSSQHGTVDVSLDAADGPVETEHTLEVRAHTDYGDIVIHRS
ncbi:DUF4097 family beta strand repeat-containing protein [Nonomuraea aridisoli]|nr:DUF4097 family beta strand repeat-containing protein [Nonomuraea aridisoli]